MQDRKHPESMIPATATLDISTFERLVSNAAMLAAQQTAERVQHDVLTKADIEAICNEAIQQFLLKLGIDPTDLPGLRKDFAEMRSFREMKQSMKEHGFKALVTLLVTGAATWLWLKVVGK